MEKKKYIIHCHFQHWFGFININIGIERFDFHHKHNSVLDMKFDIFLDAAVTHRRPRHGWKTFGQ